MALFRKFQYLILVLIFCASNFLPSFSAVDVFEEEADFATDEILVKYHAKSNSIISLGSGDDLEDLENEFINKFGIDYQLWDESSEAAKLDFINRKIKKAKNNNRIKKLKKLRKLKRSFDSEYVVLKLDQDLTKEELKSLVKKINQNGYSNSLYEVEEALPNYIFEISQTSLNDPLHSQQWEHQIVQPDLIWDETKGEDVVVAVIDTGVDYKHEDLADNIWINQGEIPGNGIDDDGNGYVDDVVGWDFVANAGPGCLGIEDCRDEDNDPSDVNGHGTHVAGIIAAVQNNNKGISGIAPKAKIMPLRAGYSVGFSAFLKTSDIINALTYAINNGADVINMSFAGYELHVLSQILNLADSLGIVCVAAAGNNSSNVKIYPAALPTVISVGALADATYKASYSNFGDWVDIVAPGSWITSTIPGNQYGTKSGTSMAAPLVAGVAALIKSKNKVRKVSTQDIKKLLIDSSYETNFLVERGGSSTIGGLNANIKFGLGINKLVMPSKSLVGEEIEFLAKASDSDHSIVAYEWMSDRDGYLSDQSSFKTSNLSLGSHAITVRAQNSVGKWSEPVFQVLNITETRSVETQNLADTIRFRMRRRQKRFYAGLPQRLRRQVQSYKWISNRDGTISERRVFRQRLLSPGYHQLSLMIQDKDGNWSSPQERIVFIH
jgi:subtilisin family serine protease